MATEANTTRRLWTMTSVDPDYPLELRRSGNRWNTIHAIGNREILAVPIVGLICSVQCPGSIVIKTFDAIRELRDAGITVAGGFHSPIERECLDFLLRGKRPVVVCPAKGLSHQRLPASWREAIDGGRLLLVTTLDESVNRTTSAQAKVRNQFAAALATAVLISHASPGGKAAALACEVADCGKPLFTFDEPDNQELVQLGARPYSVDEVGNAITLACHLHT